MSLILAVKISQSFAHLLSIKIQEQLANYPKDMSDTNTKFIFNNIHNTTKLIISDSSFSCFLTILCYI